MSDLEKIIAQTEGYHIKCIMKNGRTYYGTNTGYLAPGDFGDVQKEAFMMFKRDDGCCWILHESDIEEITMESCNILKNKT